MTATALPDGTPVRMQPPAVELAGAPREFAFPPKYGADTAAILREAGFAGATVEAMLARGIASGPLPEPA